MSEDRVSFTFQNQQDAIVELVVEPWAVVEAVLPGAIVEFQVNATPPAEIEFSITEAGQPYVYVMSERVAISNDGVALHEFRSTTRPPLAAFRVLNKVLFSRSD